MVCVNFLLRVSVISMGICVNILNEWMCVNVLISGNDLKKRVKLSNLRGPVQIT